MTIILILLCSLIINSATLSQQTQSQPKLQQEKSMSNRASGTFEVKLNPQDDGPDAPVGRMTIDKQFQGDLHRHEQGADGDGEQQHR
jgi:hypothetical protein